MSITWAGALSWRLQQQLLDPVGGVSVAEVVRRLGAVPAKEERLAELTVRLRRAQSRPDEVARALVDGRLVKVYAFRGGTHYLTPEDGGAYLALRAAGRQWERKSWQEYYRLGPKDWPGFRAAVREALADGPLTVAELGAVVTRGSAYRHLRPVFDEGAVTLSKALTWQGDMGFGRHATDVRRSSGSRPTPGGRACGTSLRRARTPSAPTCTRTALRRPNTSTTGSATASAPRPRPHSTQCATFVAAGDRPPIAPGLGPSAARTAAERADEVHPGWVVGGGARVEPRVPSARLSQPWHRAREAGRRLGRFSAGALSGVRPGGAAQTMVALTSARRASSPLTKAGDSSVDSSVASATASEIATRVGDLVVPEHLPRAEPQDRAVDGGHPVEGPALAVVGQRRVDVVPVPDDAAHEVRGVGVVGRPRLAVAQALVEERLGVEAALVRLEEDVEGPRTGLAACCQGNSRPLSR